MLSDLLAEVLCGRACRITTASEVKLLLKAKGCSQKRAKIIVNAKTKARLQQG